MQYKKLYVVLKGNTDARKAKQAEYTRRWRAAHPEQAEAQRVADYNRRCEREGIEHRPADFVAKTPSESQKACRARHPEKYRARDLVQKHVERGTMAKPETCQSCGKIARLHGHHADYAKPLEVIWLCPDCHAALHVNRKA